MVLFEVATSKLNEHIIDISLEGEQNSWLAIENADLDGKWL